MCLVRTHRLAVLRVISGATAAPLCSLCAWPHAISWIALARSGGYASTSWRTEAEYDGNFYRCGVLLLFSSLRLPVLTRCPPSPHHSPCRSLPYLQQRPVLRLDGKTSTEFRSGGLRQVDGGTAWLDTECGPGKKTVLFEPFIYKNAHLTKTGSGQTYGKLKKGPFSCSSFATHQTPCRWEVGN
jgi:hypothetical protein